MGVAEAEQVYPPLMTVASVERQHNMRTCQIDAEVPEVHDD